MIALVIALALPASAVGVPRATTIRFANEIVAPPRPLLLSDVADLSMLPPSLRSRAAHLILAPRVNHDQRIAVASLQLRLRSRMPVLGGWLRPADPSMIMIHRGSRTSDGVRTGVRQVAMAWRRPMAVKAGDKLQLSVGAGPVRVDRQVEALQSARSGGRLYVRTDDGSTLSVRLSGDAK